MAHFDEAEKHLSIAEELVKAHPEVDGINSQIPYLSATRLKIREAIELFTNEEKKAELAKEILPEST